MRLAANPPFVKLGGMVKITGEYRGELHCVATHGPSGRTLETDAPVDNQGRGEVFSTTDLVATALGTCILTTMGVSAGRLGVYLAGARFEVTKEMSTDTPRRIARLATHLWLRRPKTADAQAALERIAHACPVHQSLSPDVDLPIVFHWTE